MYSLWLRDLLHFARQRSRVIGALGQPVVLWAFLGAGFSGSFHGRSASYADYLFPSVLLLIALFAAVFSTISVIEDRKNGFLQGVLAAPVPRWAVAASKLLAGATLGLVQALLFLVLLPFTGLHLTVASVALGMLVLFLCGIALTGVGLIISWRMASTQGFHAIMSLLLIPAWVLSGAFFPAEGASSWLAWLIRLNPMHHMYLLFRDVFLPGRPLPLLAAAVTAATFAVVTIVAAKLVRTAS